MGSLILILGGGAVLLGAGIVLFASVRFLAGGGSLQQRVQIYAALPRPIAQGSRRRSRLSRMRIRLNSMLSALNSEKLALQLMQANWRMTVTEFVLIRFSLTLGGLTIGWLTTGSALPGLGLAIIAYLVPGLVLRR